MFAQIVDNSKHNLVVYRMQELPGDFKRILRVQWKELLHWLDESTVESGLGVNKSRRTGTYRNTA